MPETEKSIEEIRAELAALKAETKETKQELGELQKKRSHEGKQRVDCKGPGDGDSCPHGAFDFIRAIVKRDKAGNPKGTSLPRFWRCKNCWREAAKRDSKRWIPIDQYNKELDRLTKYWDVGPDGKLIRISWKDRPVEKKYEEWWQLRSFNLDNLPDEYYWCYSKAFPRRKSEEACEGCKNRDDCLRYKLDDSNEKLRELQKKLAKVTEPERKQQIIEAREKKREKEERKKQEELKKIEFSKLVLESLEKRKAAMTPSKDKCGYCGTNIREHKQFWAFDGHRWVRQVTGRLEMESPVKRRCDACYKDGKV